MDARSACHYSYIFGETGLGRPEIAVKRPILLTLSGVSID